MYFLKNLTHPIRLHPSYFGPNTDAFIRERLYADVEGTCTGTEGYIVAVLSITEVGAGTVEPGSGSAEFNVRYSAIVFRPFKGEVLDGTIVTVNKQGFFAEVGPMQIYVSTHLIPTMYKFDAAAYPPRFTDPGDASMTITKGARVRCKIVGLRLGNEIFAVGTIRRTIAKLTAYRYYQRGLPRVITCSVN